MKNQVEKAKAISKNILIIGDTNIDMSEDKDQKTLSQKSKTLPIYQEIMEDNSIIVMNKEKTRYEENQPPSLIDHIATNLITSMDNITTSMQPISDHCLITFNLHTKERIENEKFAFIQDWKNLEILSTLRHKSTLIS